MSAFGRIIGREGRVVLTAETRVIMAVPADMP